MLKLYISKSKKRNNFCSCVHVLVKWLPQFLDNPLHPQQCPILSIRQIKHKLRQYRALDYLLWFPSKHKSDRETREDTADKYMLCITSHYKSGPVMKSRIDYIHRSLYRGVIKLVFPCSSSGYLNPQDCGCNSFLSGWPMADYGRRRKRGALSRQRTGDLYRGVGTRGRILGNFTALGTSPRAPGGSNRGS